MIDRLDRLETIALTRRTELAGLQVRLGELARLMEEERQLENNLRKAEVTLAALTNQIYAGALDSLAELLNFGLRAVYPRQVKALVTTTVSAGRPNLEITLQDGDTEPVDPASAHGGGLAQILGLLIRALLIVATGKRRLLVLDEAFSAVSDDLQEPLSSLLRALSHDLGFQVLAITHDERLAAAADLRYTVAAPGVLVVDTD